MLLEALLKEIADERPRELTFHGAQYFDKNGKPTSLNISIQLTEASAATFLAAIKEKGWHRRG